MEAAMPAKHFSFFNNDALLGWPSSSDSIPRDNFADEIAHNMETMWQEFSLQTTPFKEKAQCSKMSTRTNSTDSLSTNASAQISSDDELVVVEAVPLGNPNSLQVQGDDTRILNWLSMSSVQQENQPLHQSFNHEAAFLSKLLVERCRTVLHHTEGNSMKAVELANIIRGLVGSESLCRARECFGGLLSLLEQFPQIFIVERIAKNDTVSLRPPRTSAAGAINLSPVMLNKNQQSQAISENQGGTPSLPPNCTRCLHIGNIPAHVSEEALRQSIERIEKVLSLKIIVKKGHRFAFVNFTTCEEAAKVKSFLSKQRLWRSAVSFAKRESFEVASQNTNQAPSSTLITTGPRSSFCPEPVFSQEVPPFCKPALIIPSAPCLSMPLAPAPHSNVPTCLSLPAPHSTIPTCMSLPLPSSPHTTLPMPHATLPMFVNVQEHNSAKYLPSTLAGYVLRGLTY